MTSPYPFVVGAKYTRRDIFSVVGIADHKGGPWFTGFTQHGDDWFIMCHVGTAGRTGHDYGNSFEAGKLNWFGRTGSRVSQPSIRSLLSGKGRVYIFYREHDRDPFTFAGLGQATKVRDETPVGVVWSVSPVATTLDDVRLPEEVPDDGTVIEGAKKAVLVNVYERDPQARRRCIAAWGLACVVCNFDFERAYGAMGAGFIHVHHLRPLSDIGEAYALDPVADLRPVCPNCHAMIHRHTPALSIDFLRQALAREE